MITNVELVSPELVYAITNKSIYSIDSLNNLSKICSLDEKNTIYANIENVKTPFRIDKGENVCISYGEEYIGKYDIGNEPFLFDSAKDRCAFCYDKEVLVINSEGKLIKKCELDSSSLMKLKFLNNGNYLVLMFNGRIELVKI